MKISVVSSILGGYSLDESLAYLSSLGVDEFELGVGGYPGKAHADALVLCKDKKAREELAETFKRHNMGISALAVHGNCVHPDKKTAAAFEADFEAACVLAGQLGVDRARHLFGLPRFRPGCEGALLGDLCMAARLSEGARMAVERNPDTVLEKSGKIRFGKRC